MEAPCSAAGKPKQHGRVAVTCLVMSPVVSAGISNKVRLDFSGVRHCPGCSIATDCAESVNVKVMIRKGKEEKQLNPILFCFAKKA